jgi:transcription elongation factor Elf1
MQVEVFFDCPKCKAELSADLDVSDHILYGGEECDECGYIFTKREAEKIYEKALSDGTDSLISRVEMYCE